MPFRLKNKLRGERYPIGVCCASRCDTPSGQTYAAKKHPWKERDDKPLCDRHFELLCDWQDKR